jgi:hypothetical protein
VTEFRILPATQAHAIAMAPRLRTADVEEVRAAAGLGGEAALLVSLARSTEAWTCLVDGVPACMWGVGPLSLIDAWGCPWLLGTPQVELYPHRFLRASRLLLRRMLATWAGLSNHVDARNRQSLRWLAWLGFAIAPALPWGVAGLPFHPFSMRREHV